MSTLDELKEKLTELPAGSSLEVHEVTLDKLLNAERVPLNSYPSAHTLFLGWLGGNDIQSFYNVNIGCIVFEKAA